MDAAADWQAWEVAVAEIAAAVKALKEDGADKNDLDPAIAELLHRKEKLRAALEAAIASAGDENTKALLTSKLPPAPKEKKSKKEKSAAAKSTPAAGPAKAPAPAPAKAPAPAPTKAPAPAPAKAPPKAASSSAGASSSLPYTNTLRALDDLMSAILTGSVSPPTAKAAAVKAVAPPKTAAQKPASAPPAKAPAPASAPAAPDGQAGQAGKKKEKVKKEAPPAAAEEARALDVSWADVRVGKVLEAVPHPESDKLYVETIDLGEDAPRQILSGLAQHMTLEQVKGAMVVCICNLKARKMAGFESQGMVLCASDAEKSKLCFVAPPAGAKPGERITWPGYEGEPETAKKMDKKKAWEAIQPEFATDASGVCVYKGAPFTLAAGACTATVTGGMIS